MQDEGVREGNFDDGSDKMHESAEASMMKELKNMDIMFPEDFNESQRQETKDTAFCGHEGHADRQRAGSLRSCQLT